MKKLFTAFLVAAFTLTAGIAGAQEKSTVGSDLKDAGKSVGHAGKKVGNKTAEIASKGASKVADQELKDKTTATGERVFVNGKDQYYWVDGKGKHRFVTKASLKAK